MNEHNDSRLNDPRVPPAVIESPNNDAPVRDEASRREFLVKSARKVAYVAPVVMLFHPKPACASNGSTLTYWDGEQIQKQPHEDGPDP